ncbi:secretion protein EccD [Mycolicibacterium aromaticivorans JS19b1 = JCM 16368]|uniref:Secretion protein EccD n=1 Tax=Mycolicibacterium aromaticivorans JS19b1 = JCM 16368 TaxID=1440774 RepID=A0A064CA47_9MYCO|nr:type VII secretion integral membrane protein EccD [Mycolicibacterium aromaticivorans]KDE97190.1 secretion protein EccD [Mycolicibacterium aromaticivorans JS19b1 = JCM 16368]
MTSVRDAPVAAGAGEESEQLRQVLVAVMINDISIGVRLDAAAAIGIQTPALVDVLNSRLSEIGKPRLSVRPNDAVPGRGRWALCWVDGTPLKPKRSLSEQGVLDGATLWLRFIDDAETRIPVIEHVTSAIPAELRKHWPSVTPPWAARVGVVLVAIAMLLVTALLLRWRYGHDDAIASAAASVCALVLIVAASVTGIRSSRTRRAAGDVRTVEPERAEVLRAELFVADTFLLLTAATTAVAAALAIPGPLGAVHAGVGAAVTLAAAGLIIRFTGRHIALCTAVVVISMAALAAGVARMLLVTSAVTLLGIVLLVSLVCIKLAPGFARMLANLRLPVFPSASGRWIFETRPDLPNAVVVPSGDTPTLEGPESVRNVIISVDRAHSLLTGLLAGFSGLMVISATALCDPRTDQRWLPVVVAATSAGAILLHARSYTDRRQSTLLAVASVAIGLAVPLRYAVGLWSPAALLIGCATMLVLTAAGLALASIVPTHVYSPMFKQIVEWVGYLLLIAPFPLTFWLMGVFTAIRYRS